MEKHRIPGVILVLSIVLSVFLVLPATAAAYPVFPEAPTGLVAVCTRYDTLELSWNSVNLATGYAVERSYDNSHWTVISSYQTGRTYKDSGLIAGQVMYYRVQAVQVTLKVRLYGLFASTSGVCVLQAPTGLAAESTGYASARVSWTASGGATGYEVWRSTASTGPWSLRNGYVRGTEYSDSALLTGTTYYYRVRAFQQYYADLTAQSPYAGPVSVVPTLAAPTWSTLESVDATTLHGTWSAVAGAEGYIVQRSTSATGPWTAVSPVSLTNSGDIPGLSVGTTYYCRVQAFRQVNKVIQYGAWSTNRTGQPLPAPPTGLAALAVDYQTIRVSWKPVLGANSYWVQRAPSPTGPWTTVSEYYTKTSLDDTGLMTGTTYHYVVRTRQISGKSVYVGSPGASVSAAPALAKASTPTTSVVGFDALRISWSAVPGADGYQVQKRITTTKTFTPVADSVTALSCNDTRLETGVQYGYQVRAYRIVLKSRVYGPWSSEGTGTPAATVPTGLTATPTGAGALRLTWNPVSGAQGYDIQKAFSSTGPWSSLVLDVNLVSLNLSQLEEKTTYYFRIRASRTVDSVKVYSDYSTPASTTTLAEGDPTPDATMTPTPAATTAPDPTDATGPTTTGGPTESTTPTEDVTPGGPTATPGGTEPTRAATVTGDPLATVSPEASTPTDAPWMLVTVLAVLAGAGIGGSIVLLVLRRKPGK